MRFRREFVSKADTGWRGGDLNTWRCDAAEAAKREAVVRRAIGRVAGDNLCGRLLVIVGRDRRSNGFPKSCGRVSRFIQGCERRAER